LGWWLGPARLSPRQPAGPVRRRQNEKREVDVY
jgi:hypothetical protein